VGGEVPHISLGKVMPAERLEFTKEETQQLERIAAYYRAAKELIIYGEQIDPNSKTLAQTLNERTNALDHIMRVILEKQGIRDKPVSDPIAYNLTNLDKAFGHICRTAYDALDWVALTIQERMAKDTESVSLDTIDAVLPEYFKDIKPNLEGIIRNDVSRLRNEKDVAGDTESNLQQFIEVVAKLKHYFDKVELAMPSLREYDKRNKRRNRMNIVWQVAVGIILVVIGWLLGHFHIFS
jgi:hypothetical protein